MTAMTDQATPSSQTDADPTTVTTGVPGLDDILGGGLVKGGLYLIEGMAGAGNTLLSAHIGLYRVTPGDTRLSLTPIAHTHFTPLAHPARLSLFTPRPLSHP